MSTQLSHILLKFSKNHVNKLILRSFSRRSVNTEGPFIVKTRKPQQENKGNLHRIL